MDNLNLSGSQYIQKQEKGSGSDQQCCPGKDLIATLVPSFAVHDHLTLCEDPAGVEPSQYPIPGILLQNSTVL